MRKPKIKRKDEKPGYNRKNNNLIGSKETVVPQKHNCVICRHPERSEVERKYLEGWLYADICRSHPWCNSDSLRKHLDITGLLEAAKEKRIINSEEILERIVRAGLPVLEEGKVYPRDIIEAIKALNELKNKDRTDSLWELIAARKKENGTPIIIAQTAVLGNSSGLCRGAD